ncbi:NAD-dependent epimerase/dehydratase family protein, partial [Streptomyces sp. NPDC056512]|uniref:NAD-dependent epimerase/dehydratase family protein n=1 Tax=Streptomyces sp. NPDC056512 TaxID=3345846 RepID=UPI0036A485FA
MRILLLGGTWFLGRAVAENALARGWRVTTFNRGRSAPDLPGTEPVHGDRTSADDLKRLAGYGPWDLVVDTSASEMAPCQVLDGTRVLAAEAERYVYVSTVNAYRGWPHEALTEDSPVYAAPPDASREYGAGDGVTVHYGMQKAGCEAAVLSQFGDRATVLRPGVILGPGEYVGRLPWWLSRARRGGAILAPGQPGTHVQPVDVRDVAEFALSASPGAYNVAAPRDRDTMGDLLGACVAVTGSRGRLAWAPDELLTAHGVREWTELPLWRTAQGTWAVDSTRAQAAGLVCRPLAQTVADTWEWLTSGGVPGGPPPGGGHRHDPPPARGLLAPRRLPAKGPRRPGHGGAA